MKKECHDVICCEMKNAGRGNLPARGKNTREDVRLDARHNTSRVRGQAFMQTRIHKRDRNHRYRRYANETLRDLNLDGTRSLSRARASPKAGSRRKR